MNTYRHSPQRHRMSTICRTLLILCCALGGISGCVVTAPAKAVWTGGKMAGKGLVYAGKGLWTIGKLPVRITNAALDTTSRMLLVTTQFVDLAGKIVTISSTVPKAALEAELQKIERSLETADYVRDVLSVTVDEVPH